MNSEEETKNYFLRVADGSYSARASVALNLLDEAAALLLTEAFRYHPVIESLDGLLLDDPNTSDHHVLLRRHPFQGQVLYLAHDDGSRIVFASLAELVEAAEKAKTTEISLPDLHPQLSPCAEDQAAVSDLVRALVDDGEVDAALTLIPSMDLTDIELLSWLASHEDFYLAEAVGNEIAKRPSEALRSAALLCSTHRHPQAARSGVNALKALGT